MILINLTKLAIERAAVTRVPVPEAAEEVLGQVAVMADIVVNEELTLKVGTAYFSSKDGAARIQCVKAMADHGLICAERVWGADWNCVADRDIDAWAKYPNIQGGKELDRAFAAHGLRDWWRWQEGDEARIWSHPARRPGDHPTRIDRFYLPTRHREWQWECGSSKGS